jgi:L-fuconolactonase
MANTIKMVDQCPDVQFILDHIGKPDIKDQLLDPWKKEIKQLSTFSNVHCKMSGLVTEADHEKWVPEDLKPYIDHVLDCFGFERTMFGGDWPVAVQATEYPRWVGTLEWALQGCSEARLPM